MAIGEKYSSPYSQFPSPLFKENDRVKHKDSGIVFTIKGEPVYDGKQWIYATKEGVNVGHDVLEGEEKNKEGSITWFKCNEEIPRKDPLLDGKFSVPVLVTDFYDPEKKVVQTRYCYHRATGQPFWGCYFLPTHWAFINLPTDPYE